MGEAGSLHSRPRGARLRRGAAILLALGVLSGGIVASAPPALAAGASLTITPTTWNIIGLDSNKPSVTNGHPNEFPVGAKVCNTGDAAASSVQTSFAWTTTNSNISLSNATTTRSIGSLAAGACQPVTYNVTVNRNQQSFNTRTRGYQITATATGGLSASTPANRELYVEKLVSQSRNAVVSIDSAACSSGSCTVYKGNTYQFTLNSKTATGGYEQLETFINFPDSMFEIENIHTTYNVPGGSSNDRVYADACGWDPVTTSATYRSCIGPTNFSGGKAGGAPIKTVYTVKVVGTGTGTLSGLVYDFSGSSFHYNADFGTGVNAVDFTAADAADLSLTKTHTGAFVRGSTGTYHLNVSNAGPATSGAVTVTDTLPTGMTYKSFSGTGWSCSSCSSASQTVTLTHAALASGASASVDLTVDVGAGASSSPTNTATVTQATSATLNDPSSANNSASDPGTVANPGDADVVVTKTTPGIVEPGGQGTYTLHVRDDGPNSVVGPVTVTDVLPTGLSFVSGTGTGWTCTASGQTVTCTRSSGLVSGEVAPDITMVVNVAPDAPARSTNKTSGSGAVDNDPNHSNNIDVTDTVLVGQADLSIDKTHSGSFPRGGTGTYSITVSNAGPDAAASPRVVDTLPAGLTFSSSSGTGWSCSSSGQVVTCNQSSDVASGQSAPKLTINVSVSSSAAAVVTNTATVCSMIFGGTVTGCPDQNEGTYERSSSDNTVSDVTATVAPTDLAITNTASVTTVNTGTSYTYTLKATNNGPNSATNVTIVDSLPSYIDSASITTNPGSSNTSTPPYCDVTGREVTCVMGTVGTTSGANSATAVITVKGLATASGRTVADTASVFSDLGDTNASNDSATATVTFNGTLNNAAPTAADKTASVAHGNTSGVDVTLTGTDADGDPLTFNLPSANGGAAHGTVTISGNIATYVPNGDYVGTDTFQYRSNDGVTNSTAATVTVTVTNTPPTAVDKTMTVPHRSTGVGVTLSGSDADRDPLTYNLPSVNGGAAHGTVTISGTTATYVPAGNYVGTDSFQYRSNDGAENSAPATVAVTVTNTPPTFTAATLSPRSVGTTGTVTATAESPSDADGDTLAFHYVWTRVRNGSTSTIRDVTLAGATDSLDLSSVSGGVVANDEIAVAITVNDGFIASATRTDSIVAGNVAPSANGDSVTTPEDTAKTIDLTASDSDGDPLTYKVTNLPSHGSLYEGNDTTGTEITSVPFDLSGTAVTFDPTSNYNGNDSFDFKANDGKVDSATATIAVAVRPVNDAPTAQDGDITVGRDLDTGAVDLSTLVADHETDNAALTYQIVTQPAGGTADIQGSVVTYTRTAAGRSPDQLTYKVVDRGDPDNCTVLMLFPCAAALDSNTATIDVSFDNSTPKADDQSVSLHEDSFKAITLTGSDPDLDALTFTVTTLPANGTLYEGSDATGAVIDSVPFDVAGSHVTYEPDADYNGSDSFDFVSDDGALTSTDATVSMEVTPVNDRPTANDDHVTTDEDTAAQITLTGDDVDGDALSYKITALPAHGVLHDGADATAPAIDSAPFDVSGTDVTFEPDANYHGSDSFDFVSNDGTLSSTDATVSIDVTSVNDAPQATDEAVGVEFNSSGTLPLEGHDVDGDAVSFTVVDAPSFGTLGSVGTPTCAPASEGETCTTSVGYTPDGGYYGPDQVTYEVNDGSKDSSLATVAITVGMPGDPSPTPTPTDTNSPTASVSPTPTETATATPTPSPTHSSSWGGGGGGGGGAPAPSATPDATPSATPAPSESPSSSASPDPIASPSASPTQPGACGDPIEADTADGAILATPCDDPILVHASVPGVVHGFAGRDTITILGSAPVHVFAGSGDDDVTCGDGSAVVKAGKGRDVVHCGIADDAIRGGRGHDRIDGGEGNDRLLGGKGNDRLRGAGGDDYLSSGRGDDLAYGGSGNDVVKGQPGNDALHGGIGDDLERGAAGNDVESGDGGNDLIRGGFGNDRLMGGINDDRLLGDEGADRLQGGNGVDILLGAQGADFLQGRGGDDTLKGGSGNDDLKGLWGNDLIESGSGHNDLVGGSGTDTCVARAPQNSWRGCERHYGHRPQI